MSSNTTSPINAQTTNTVSTVNLSAVGMAPAVALGSLYQTIGNSVSMAAANAVFAQQQSNMSFQAVTAAAINHLLAKK